MISNRANLNWFRQQLQDRIGLTQSEAGDLVRNTMIAGQLTGWAPIATCLPKMSARSRTTKKDGRKTDFSIPPALWNFIDVDWDEKNPCYNFHTEQDSWIIHHIFIDRISAIIIITNLEYPANNTQLAFAKSAKGRSENKNRGGRPRKYDWEKCQIEAERWMSKNGPSSTLTALYNHMALWFGSKEPAESTLKEKLRPIYRKFR